MNGSEEVSLNTFSREKTRVYFNAIASKWDSLTYHDPSELRDIVAQLKLTAADRVLDVAAGTGILLPFLYRKTKKVTALDVAPEMVEQAKANHPNIKVSYVTADFLEYNVSGAYDALVIYNSYPHFEDKALLASRMNSALSPGGRFIIAHCESREEINARHAETPFQLIAVEIGEAIKEAEWFSKYFKIEKLVDDSERYIILGTKREQAI